MNVVVCARRWLINIGRLLPFGICFIVFLSSVECVVAVACDRYVFYYGLATPDTPISFLIGSVFEYDLLTIVILIITSVAVEACTWNKITILYLAVLLWFKSYIADMEIDTAWIAVISSANILVSGYLCYKGIILFLKMLK